MPNRLPDPMFLPRKPKLIDKGASKENEKSEDKREVGGLGDAINRARNEATTVARHDEAIAEQREWIRVESLALTRRFIASLARAGHGPLLAHREHLTRRVVEKRVDVWPYRHTVRSCAWTRSTTPVGDAWPLFGQQWVELTRDISEPSLSNDGYGKSVYAGVIFLPNERRFATAIFPTIIRQRDGNEWVRNEPDPAFGRLLRSGAATLREVKVGTNLDRCGCGVCYNPAPPWASGSDWASLPVGEGVYTEDDGWGHTRTVYPAEELVPVADRYDKLLGRAVRLFNQQLTQLGAEWAPVAGVVATPRRRGGPS